MSRLCTLHEIAIKHAKKQPGLVDSLTEESPILKVCKWKPATHGLFNVAERLVEVNGAGFVEIDAPLPMMSASTELEHTDLHMLGGMMEVPTQRAMKLGGPSKYFADKQDALLKSAASTVEKRLVLKNWLEAAKKSGNLRDAGGADKGWFIMAVRFDELGNTGLYDEGQFDKGRILNIKILHGGEEDYLKGKGYEGVLGYTVVYRGNFGWQILDAARTCSAIVNIDETSKPSVNDIDNMLADVRAQPGNTYIFCSPRGKIHAINPYKVENVHLSNTDTDAKTRVETWNGISIITSYNIMDKINHIKVA